MRNFIAQTSRDPVYGQLIYCSCPQECPIVNGIRHARCNDGVLLTHGARSVLRATTVAQRVGRPIDGLRQWAQAVQGRTNHNKAACALANKMARICYAALRDAADDLPLRIGAQTTAAIPKRSHGVLFKAELGLK